MINIDSVYQKVLVLSSKEKRGYITPQEFNLLVNKAQMEIFEEYFHNFKTAEMKPKSHLQFADEIELLEQKLHPFRMFKTLTLTAQTLPGYIVSLSEMASAGYEVYYLDGIRLKSVDNLVTSDGFNPEIVPMAKHEFLTNQTHPFTKATTLKPVYERITDNGIKIWPGPTGDQNWGITIDSFRKPKTAKWGYVVVQGKAMYNNNSSFSTDLELHASEEELVVSKVLQLAGVTIMKQELIQAGGGMEAAIRQSKDD